MAGLSLLALFVSLPSSYGLMVAWPWVVFWQIGFLLIASWLIWRFRQFQSSFLLLGFQFDWAIALSAFSLVSSTLFAFQSASSIWYLAMAGSYGLTLYALVNWLTGLAIQDHENTLVSELGRQRREWLFTSLGVFTLLTSGISLTLWSLNKNNFTEPVNPYPLGHHNFVSGYLVLSLPILFCLGFQHRGWLKIFWFTSTGLAIITLYTTGSRGGALGFLTLLLVGAVAIANELQQTSAETINRFRQWLPNLIVGLIVILGLGLVVANPRVQRLTTAISEGAIEGNAQFRIFTIEAGLNLWRHHPWFGIGLGNTIKLYDLYRPIEAGVTAFRVQQLHCTPVQLLAELGLIGFTAYLLFIALVSRLIWKLTNQFKVQSAHNSSFSDRLLFYGCSTGLIGYAVSSLTDFQLENIGISLTITIFLAILINLAQEFVPAPAINKISQQRALSLVTFTLAIAALRIWIPADTAMMLAATGTDDLQAGNFAGFYRQWSSATKIAPQEPYYQFLLGTQLTEVLEAYQPDSSISSSHDSQILGLPKPAPQYQQQIAQSAQAHLQRAVALVPSDELFNRYLGAWLIDQDGARAAIHLRQAAQLTPRKPYTYAMLGAAYFNQKNYQAASKAFAIEGLINPEFLTTEIWLDPAFKPLWAPTLQTTLTLYQQCLARLASQQSAYNSVYQNMAMLRWWDASTTPSSEKDINIDLSRLSPNAQAVILSDRNQLDEAMALLQSHSTEFVSESTALLRGWLSPKQYLPNLQNQISSPALQEALPDLITSIQDQRRIRPWLASLHTYTKAISERIGFFSYRNTNGPDTIEVPRLLPVNLLVHNLKLFNSIGLLPELDQTLISAHQTLLDLDRPVEPH